MPHKVSPDLVAKGKLQYYPLAVRRLSQGILATDRLFTGQRLDDTGLYYYNARYYDPTIGRFISPDIIVQSKLTSQTFNRYSYCLNNPLRFIDPTGRETYGIIMEGAGGAGGHGRLTVAFVFDTYGGMGMIVAGGANIGIGGTVTFQLKQFI